MSYDGAKQRHRAPWLVTVYHGGAKKRTYHSSFLGAVKAKKKSERLPKKEGSRAFAYSREAQVEYNEAKRLVGEDVQLPEFLYTCFAHVLRREWIPRRPSARMPAEAKARWMISRARSRPMALADPSARDTREMKSG